MSYTAFTQFVFRSGSSTLLLCGQFPYGASHLIFFLFQDADPGEMLALGDIIAISLDNNLFVTRWNEVR